VDFFSRQAAARGQTRWLVISFILSLLAVALALDLVLFTFLASSRAHAVDIDPLGFAARNPGAAIFSTLLVMGVLGLASLYKSVELRGGGGVVARSLGGVLVDPDTRDVQRKRLLNVVSEMAIASSVPMPEVYVLEQEAAINAFAAGQSPANAAVTVTQGALDRLNRDQLQGVIGHEFSHILNGDMRLNVQLMGWVFGLFVVGLIGRLIFDFSPRDRRNNNNAIVVLGLAVMVLGYVGMFFGRLLQAAVSRQRERLADASGVQFTRNPQGLKEALIRIAALPEGSALATPQAEQAAHMFFAAGLTRAFATHPPLLERIRELDPQFDESEIARVAAQMEAQSAVTADAGTQAIRSGFGAPAAGFAGVSPLAGGIASSNIQQSVPDAVREFQSPGRAQAFVIALLLSKEPAVRQRQLTLLGQRLSAGNLAFLQQIAPAVDAIDPMQRLPALQQVFPALRRVPVPQRKALAALASELIYADARIDVFEFSLAKLLETLLSDELEARVPHGTVSLEAAQEEINVLFTALAQLGASNEHDARIAHEAGMTVVLPMRTPEYTPLSDWARQLSEALPRLEQLQPFAKKRLIDGLVKTITTDEVMTEAESELLRTVCALLHCPLPIFSPGTGASHSQSA
jgi:Zn-dependent protease with chaperone function